MTAKSQTAIMHTTLCKERLRLATKLFRSELSSNCVWESAQKKFYTRLNVFHDQFKMNISFGLD